jgi:hypothetical protein
MVYGPVVEQGICIIRTNKKLQKLYKNLDTLGRIKKKLLKWKGHLVRMDHGRAVKEIFESKLEGRRRRGTYRLR